MQIIRNWFNRHFSDPQVIILIVLLLTVAAVILLMGKILAPVLASVVLAYLLEGLVGIMERHKIPRLFAVIIVFLIFILFLFFLLFGLLPILSQQVVQAAGALPAMVIHGRQQLMLLPELYPDYFSQDQVSNLMNMLQTELVGISQKLISISVASVRGVVTFLVYIILMPLLVFFFLKDKVDILNWLSAFLPDDCSLSFQVWREVDQQIGNYTRGKFWEILFVGVVSYAAFHMLGLQFAMLNGFLAGLSVLVPYVGVTVVFFPIALMGYFQFGWSSEFLYVVLAYLIIQILDGNLLAPLLLSEVVNLHPIAIIVAVLVFGGLWGFLGVFFAIPLATLVQAILRSWPVKNSLTNGAEKD